MITQKRLQELFYYNQGQLFRRVSIKGREVGSLIGTVNKKGYRVAVVDSKSYRVHHLVWIYHNGVKVKELDHINRNRDDNRIDNLRPCTHTQNLGNMRPRSHKYKGVTFCKATSKWRAQLSTKDQHYCLGRHSTIEQAALAYNKKAKEYFGDFALLNEVEE